jgi:hypothetical protein
MKYLLSIYMMKINICQRSGVSLSALENSLSLRRSIVVNLMRHHVRMITSQAQNVRPARFSARVRTVGAGLDRQERLQEHFRERLIANDWTAALGSTSSAKPLRRLPRAGTAPAGLSTCRNTDQGAGAELETNKIRTGGLPGGGCKGGK